MYLVEYDEQTFEIDAVFVPAQNGGWSDPSQDAGFEVYSISADGKRLTHEEIKAYEENNGVDLFLEVTNILMEEKNGY